jgi:hypothetical protein
MNQEPKQEIVRREADPIVIELRTLRTQTKQMQHELGFHIRRGRRLELLCLALGVTEGQVETVNREAKRDLGI